MMKAPQTFLDWFIKDPKRYFKQFTNSKSDCRFGRASNHGQDSQLTEQAVKMSGSRNNFTRGKV